MSLFQKKIKKEDEKRKLSSGMFIKLKKTNVYIYTAPIESIIFLCSCACFVQFVEVILQFLPFS